MCLFLPCLITLSLLAFVIDFELVLFIPQTLLNFFQSDWLTYVLRVLIIFFKLFFVVVRITVVKRRCLISDAKKHFTHEII